MPTHQRQSESGGPLLTALMTLCAYHGRAAHRDTLISGLPLTDGKLTPSVFDRAARRAQFSSRLLQRSLAEINTALLPAILLLENEEVCVVTRLDLDKGLAEVIYPELDDAAVEVPIEQLQAQYVGHVIYCRPNFKLERQHADFGTDRKQHWFWGIIRQNRRLYGDVIVAAVLINLFAVAMPLFVLNVWDRVLPNAATETLWAMALGLVIVLVASLVLKSLRAWFVDLAASRADIRLSSRIMERVLAMKMQDRPEASGAFAANIQSFESVRSFIGSMTLVALVDFPFVLLFVGIIAWINLLLVIPIVVGAVIVLGYALISQRNMHKLAEAGMQGSAQRNSTLIESLGNLEAVKSFNVQGDVQAKWEESTIFLSRNAAKMRLLSSSVTNGAGFMQHFVGMSIVIVGVYLAIDGQLTRGGLIAAYLLSSRAMAPISQAAGLLAHYHQAAKSMELLETIMERPVEYQESDDKIDRPVIRGDIEFRNVSFAYPGAQQQALTDINLNISAGEHVAILGKNGSGKTTLEKLIMGLYQPTQGSVLIDGIDMRQLDITQLRRNIGYVPQEVSLFQGSLKHNIVLTSPDEDTERLLRIVRLTGLDSTIRHHPEGINMPVGERGQQLSGGQRQSVGIARALINEPPLLLLDEPTASLDHTSEEQIKKNLAIESQDRTLVLVTHRSSLLELAQRLVVIDRGRIVADGSKETVMEALRQGRVSGAR
ncbi:MULTISPECIES: type I secretion system permease/ATPase [unclassified Wenzhouxiangella]|uniref:type I secretion system permease/ATPase n=1 Tax=unclassified Wenzhouxiangella TaxID=2613841 RepID=UPI000E32C796|nr:MULTISPECIES: type I secretion system permease/ATPase [unclassified Wenzhouxiangella]RFF26506.1 type I secretion system permease/ATPase [Wenzhouxiangella sp. 15181]RFP69697.1 type I secretion system permease/ATPase [Wenzhouxiangella sp. 15190]